VAYTCGQFTQFHSRYNDSDPLGFRRAGRRCETGRIQKSDIFPYSFAGMSYGSGLQSTRPFYPPLRWMMMMIY